MFNWIHHILEPHCSECARLKECQSCDTLREQLGISNAEKERLLNLLLEKSNPKIVESEPVKTEPIGPRHVPWRVRQQMLESADRRQAELLKKNAEEEKRLGPPISTEDLEKEMDIVAKERENAVGSSNA